VIDDWRMAALCAETDPDVFYSDRGEGGGKTRVARSICRRCMVRRACLDYALRHDERFGVWGGLSPVERGRLRRNVGAVVGS
jgi:WhiB family redox-sensing transcriptional regulator